MNKNAEAGMNSAEDTERGVIFMVVSF